MSVKTKIPAVLSLLIVLLFGVSASFALRKNVASQRVCAQMYLVAGGAHTSGTTTVYYHLDGTSTQQTGSTATHMGNGTWCYNPAQAETNGDFVAYTFHPNSTIALDALIQMYTAVDVSHVNGTAQTARDLGAGVNVTHVNGTAQTARDLGAGVNVTHVNGTATTATLDTIATGVSTANAHLNGTLAAGTHQPQSGDAHADGTAILADLALIPHSSGTLSLNATANSAIAVATRDIDNTMPAASSLGAAVNSAASAGDPWATALPGAYGAGTAGDHVGNMLSIFRASQGPGPWAK